MGKKKRNGEVDGNRERVSLDSLDHLNGRVPDFLGIETKRANERTRKKLKCLCLLVFFLVILVLLLVGYITAVTARPDLFSFTNNDSDNETEVNALAIRVMKGDHKSVKGGIDNNTKVIEELLDWQKKKKEEAERTNYALEEQKNQFNALYAQMKELSSSLNDLRNQTASLEADNRQQILRNEELENRLDEFDKRELSVARRVDEAIANATDHVNQHSAQIQRLGSFLADVTETIREIDNRTKEELFNLTSSITDVTNNVTRLQNENEKFKRGVTARFKKINDNVEETLTRQNATNTAQRVGLQRSVSVLEDRVHEAARNSADLLDILDRMNETHYGRERWTKKRFEEQNELMNQTMENLRTLEDSATKHRFALDELNASFSNEFDRVEREFRSNVAKAKNETRRMVDDLQEKMEDDIARSKENATQGLLHTKGVLEKGLDEAKTDLVNKTDSLERQYFELRTGISEEKEFVQESQNAILHRIGNTNSSINSLRSEIGELKEDKSKLNRALSNITEKLRDDEEEFLLLKRNITRNLDGLRSAFDSDKLANMVAAQNRLSARISTFESKLSSLSGDLEEKLHKTNATLEALAAATNDVQLATEKSTQRLKDELAKLEDMVDKISNASDNSYYDDKE